MKTFIIFLLIFVAIAVGWFLFKNSSSSSDNIVPEVSGDISQKEVSGNPYVTLSTTKGNIVIELFVDKTPITAKNFLKLARAEFYDNTKFHRVIKNFMLQGGDPNSKTENQASYGSGGPGYTIKDEFIEGLSNVRGTISMANTGVPDSGGSQFFINLIDNTRLDFDKEPFTSKHPVFGRVTEGMDVVDAISEVSTGAQDIPIEPVVIQSVTIKE